MINSTFNRVFKWKVAVFIAIIGGIFTAIFTSGYVLFITFIVLALMGYSVVMRRVLELRRSKQDQKEDPENSES